MTYYIVGWPKKLCTALADEAQNPVSQVNVIHRGLYYISHGSLTWVIDLITEYFLIMCKTRAEIGILWLRVLTSVLNSLQKLYVCFFFLTHAITYWALQHLNNIAICLQHFRAPRVLSESLLHLMLTTSSWGGSVKARIPIVENRKQRLTEENGSPKLHC